MTSLPHKPFETCLRNALNPESIIIVLITAAIVNDSREYSHSIGTVLNHSMLNNDLYCVHNSISKT